MQRTIATERVAQRIRIVFRFQNDKAVTIRQQDDLLSKLLHIAKALTNFNRLDIPAQAPTGSDTRFALSTKPAIYRHPKAD